MNIYDVPTNCLHIPTASIYKCIKILSGVLLNRFQQFLRRCIAHNYIYDKTEKPMELELEMRFCIISGGSLSICCWKCFITKLFTYLLAFWHFLEKFLARISAILNVPELHAWKTINYLDAIAIIIIIVIIIHQQSFE